MAIFSYLHHRTARSTLSCMYNNISPPLLYASMRFELSRLCARCTVYAAALSCLRAVCLLPSNLRCFSHRLKGACYSFCCLVTRLIMIVILCHHPGGGDHGRWQACAHTATCRLPLLPLLLPHRTHAHRACRACTRAQRLPTRLPCSPSLLTCSIYRCQAAFAVSCWRREQTIELPNSGHRLNSVTTAVQ